MDPNAGASSTRQVVAALALVAMIDTVWLALTGATGKTYHLAPLLVAAAPGILLRGSGRARLLAVAIGAAAVAIGWGAITLAGIQPTATVLHAQPGGVAGEVVLLGLIGLAVGAGRGPGWLVVSLRDRRRR